MIMVDTSVWIDYFNGVENAGTIRLDQYLVNDLVVTGDIILAEILQGFRSDRDFSLAKEALLRLDCFGMIGIEIAIASAENFRLLRKKGVTIRKTTDMIIATFCMINNLPLLFNDRDFQPISDHLGLIPAADPPGYYAAE